MTERFLFIPPVDESMPPLKAGQWVLLFASFCVSLALFALFMFMTSGHAALASLALFALIIAKMPMQAYAMNRKGRIVGKLFLALMVAATLYFGWTRIEAQFNRSPIITPMLIALCCWAYWFSLETAKVNKQFLKRIDALDAKLERNVSAMEIPEEESIRFSLPDPAEYGWDTIHISPAVKRYERSVSYGGPPIFHETIEYDLRPQYRPDVVFVRLVDMWKENLSETSYQVINGTIFRSAEDGDASDELESQLVWHELRGPEVYTILSAHGKSKDFFHQKRTKLKNALKQITAKAEVLGAVQIEEYGQIRYEAELDANAEQRSEIEAGIAELVSEKNLKQYGVSPCEVFNKDYVYVLDKLAGDQPGDVVQAEELEMLGLDH